MNSTKDEELGIGSSLKVSWLDDLQRVVAGVDYDHLKAHVSRPQIQADLLKRSADRVGFYLNDTFTLGDLAVTPSARFDHTDTGGDLFSPSFGITYSLTDNSVIRGYTARGYSLTSLSRDSSTEKVWTSQVGFESADIPFLWLKGTLFRNETWDITVLARNPDGSISSFKQRHLKQGYELEARTLPFLGTSLSIGYTFIHARNGDTDAILKGVPRHTLDLGIKYEDSRFLRAVLIGHYIDWNAASGAKDRDILWDLHLSKKISYSENSSVDLFVSVRNLFNVDQYADQLYKNPGRWVEGGVRCAF
jgi:vitamin B12 transporter